MEEFPTVKGSWPWPWLWIGLYCIPSCITHRPLHTRQISLKSKNVLWTHGRTYSQTDGRTDIWSVFPSTPKSRPKIRRQFCFLVFFIFLPFLVPCARLSWLFISFWAHVNISSRIFFLPDCLHGLLPGPFLLSYSVFVFTSILFF